ncbi:uncharacterized protein J4E92_005511 [Alternaria infectoria]|uniref:uncharacterized protein n=1 Tax=Alternaria infectoria TaxID=45303 RepID=UPI00221EFF19|nr:uncharacterized protein J4E92_005511 [Alternaria infectoria]KAI4928029.1 hypothetical protein J4E92_005511 [Alternaria infectoria]
MAPTIQEPTKDVRINKAVLKEQQNKHPAVLAKLRNAIPTDYYPTVEASQQDIYYGRPFYPGKVLLGTNDGTRVWGYLRRIMSNHKTTMEVHYEDNRGGDNTDHTPFAQSQFVPWCRLVADDACPLGTAAWEERLKIVIKIVMLEAGYSEATVSGIPADLLASIRKNVEKGLHNVSQAARPSIYSSAGLIAAPAASASAPGHTAEGKDSIALHMSRLKSQNMTATNCIKALKDVIPAEHWFQTRPMATNIARKVTLLNPDDKEHFALFPGKVLIGHLRDTDSTPVWAAFRRPRRTAKIQTPQWRMCFFDDKLFEIELPATLNGTVEFAPGFQLLTESKDTVVTRKVWLARVGMCARVALIDAGLHDDEGFATRGDARPKELVAVIKKARLRRTLQGDGQLEALPPPYRKSWKNHTPEASAVDATVRDPVQAPTDTQPRNDEQQAQSPPEDLIQDLIEISEDEDDIMESGYQLRASSPWPTFPKRELFTPAPTSTAMNKKQKIAPSNRTSLLDFINLTTAIDTPDTTALEKQVRALTEAKTSLEETVNDMKAQISDYKKKNRELQVFKAKHVEHCQAVMLKLLTQRNVRNGSSEVDAERDAKTEYTQVYGIAIVEDIGED